MECSWILSRARVQHGRVCRVRSVAGVGGGGVRAQQASAASSKVCFEVADKSGFGCPAMVRRFGALSHTKPTVTREEGACDRGGLTISAKVGEGRRMRGVTAWCEM